MYTCRATGAQVRKVTPPGARFAPSGVSVVMLRCDTGMAILEREGEPGASKRRRLPLHVRDDPAVDEFGDLEVVLLDHDHMAVTADAPVPQSNEVGLYAGLVRPLRSAMIEHRVIGRLRHQDHGRDTLEVDQLTRWLLLHPARHEVRAVSLVLLN